MPIPSLRQHIVLVSGQAVPNVLGACLPGREPAHIHAIVTPKMREAARQLEAALKQCAPACAFTPYTLDNDTGQEAMYTLLDHIHEECHGEALGINLTGGTKLMALAAAEWAYTCDVPTFYIDTAHDQVIAVGREWQYAPLPDVLDVRTLLLAHGREVESSTTASVPAERRDVLQRLLEFACTAEGERALGRLNGLALRAKAAGLIVPDDGSGAAWETLLALCESAGILQADAGHVAFPDEQARQWCNGFWFEEYVHMALYRLKADKGIRDWAASVDVIKGGVRNELDAAFSVRNRLFIIECKTANMSGSYANAEDKPANTLYKVDALHDKMGGIFAQAMLCSVRPLDTGAMKRAKEHNIRVLCGKKLLRLREELQDWIAPA